MRGNEEVQVAAHARAAVFQAALVITVPLPAFFPHWSLLHCPMPRLTCGGPLSLHPPKSPPCPQGVQGSFAGAWWSSAQRLIPWVAPVRLLIS